ncbi:MAG: transposase, partial [Rhodococcus sp. (in: high G+C Gram-positive bacteria)]|uniref:transposase n=1 Tax=Rhodococcus sp. TaxID=1831 RepID=UPI003BB096C8
MGDPKIFRYTQRWTIETAFDELKSRLRGRAVVLRSKTPVHVRQEIYGILLTHFGVRAMMH